MTKSSIINVRQGPKYTFEPGNKHLLKIKSHDTKAQKVMMLSFFVYIIHASKNATGWAAVFIATSNVRKIFLQNRKFFQTFFRMNY